MAAAKKRRILARNDLMRFLDLSKDAQEAEAGVGALGVLGAELEPSSKPSQEQQAAADVDAMAVTAED